MRRRFFILLVIMLVSFIGLSQQSFADKSLISQTVDQKLHREPGSKTFQAMLNKITKKKISPSPSHVSPAPDQCRSEALEMQFKCPPDWSVSEEKNNALFFSSADGSASLRIAPIDTTFRYLYQLDKTGMQKIGNYADGFVVEETTFAGKSAFRVKAFSNETPPSRLTDYYLMHRGTLCRISFSVTPKELWNEYKFLVQELSKSFSFFHE